MAPSLANRSLANQPTAIETLRDATSTIHLRLHAHPAFAQLQGGDISHAAYVHLLTALYGFHGAFRDVAAEGPARCLRLADDLTFLGVSLEQIARMPLAAAPRTQGHVARWGIDYVLRGASLGGRVLARNLDHLLDPGRIDGRRFFMENGAKPGSNWRDFLQQIEQALPTITDRRTACEAAVATFEKFEVWMSRAMSPLTQGRAIDE